MTPDSARALPHVGQIVLLTSDLDAAVDRARTLFGITETTADAEGMAKIGFRHAVFGFSDTYVEICEPVSPVSSSGRLLSRHGDCGFMVVVQIEDAALMRGRAGSLGFTPLVSEDYEGSPISQWSPRDFGTIAEFDQLIPPTSWHLAPDVYDCRSTNVVTDIVGVELAVSDPQTFATRWATVMGAGDVTGETGSGITAVELSRSVLRFTTGSVTGVRAVDVTAADRSRVGESVELCGVRFHFV